MNKPTEKKGGWGATSQEDDGERKWRRICPSIVPLASYLQGHLEKKLVLLLVFYFFCGLTGQKDEGDMQWHELCLTKSSFHILYDQVIDKLKGKAEYYSGLWKFDEYKSDVNQMLCTSPPLFHIYDGLKVDPDLGNSFIKQGLFARISGAFNISYYFLLFIWMLL